MERELTRSTSWAMATEVNILFMDPRFDFVSMRLGALKSYLAIPIDLAENGLPVFGH